MQAMFEQAVAPELRVSGPQAVLGGRCLHTFGLGESDINERVADLMTPGRNPEVGTTAGFGIVVG